MYKNVENIEVQAQPSFYFFHVSTAKQNEEQKFRTFDNDLQVRTFLQLRQL